MVNQNVVPPQIAKYVDLVDDFMARYPTVTMYGAYLSLEWWLCE